MPDARSPFRNQERKAVGDGGGGALYQPSPASLISPLVQTIKPIPILFSHGYFTCPYVPESCLQIPFPFPSPPDIMCSF